MQNPKFKGLLATFAVLTVLGTILAVYTCITTFTGSPTFLSGLFAVSHLVCYATLIVYGCLAYRREQEKPFQTTVYTYAALLGIQILQNGQFMPGMGLDEGVLLFINVANLVAFVNVIKFADSLANKKAAIVYLAIAVLLKLAAELVLIVLFISTVNVHQVLMALSVPLLGTVLLVAYLSRTDRLSGAESVHH